MNIHALVLNHGPQRPATHMEAVEVTATCRDTEILLNSQRGDTTQ